MHLKAIELNEEFGYNAEEMGRQAMAIYEQLGQLEGRANQCNKLGSDKGIATSCADLGLSAAKRGDYSEARAMWTRALELSRQAGMPPEADRVQGWQSVLA